MKTCAIIPVWNGNGEQHEWTMRSVRTLLASDSDIFGLYVDNASPYPDTRPYLWDASRQRPDRLGLIANEENKGYGGALNQGLLLAYYQGFDLFICLNNDIEFTRPSWHHPFLAHVGYKVLMGPRLIQDNRWVYFDGIHHPYLEGYCLAFGRSFLHDVGFFDEWFFPAWCEDVELSWRALQKGYELLELPIPLHHAGGRTGYDGRVAEYLTADEMAKPVATPLGRLESQHIQAARRMTQRNVEKLQDKVRRGDTSWQGPHLKAEV